MHSYLWNTTLLSIMLLGLNPCCNGRCTRTRDGWQFFENLGRSLNPCCNGRCTRTANEEQARKFFLVLILVVMEDALVQVVPLHCVKVDTS